MIWDKRTENFNTDFRCFFRVIEILRNNDIYEIDKVNGAYKILYGNKETDSKVNAITEYFNAVNGTKKADGEKCFDFIKDQNLIYSAFWQTYGIDLRSAELDIFQFFALFDGLADNTRLAEVIRIRTEKIPKRTKDNGEYINALIKAKNAVALQERPQGASVFSSFAETIHNLAKKC